MEQVEVKESVKMEGAPKEPSIFKNKNFLLLFIGTLFSSPGYYVYLMGAEWLTLF